MFLSGDTGSGKTTLANVLLYAKKYTISLRSKADDAPLPGMRIRRVSEMRNDVDRFVLDPKFAEQGAEFTRAINRVWKEAGWTLYVDELYYLTNELRRYHLERQISMLLTQGRSKHITVMNGCQRPAWIPLFAPTQATHLIAFRHSGIDLKRLKDVGSDEWAAAISDLKRYEFAWMYRPTREIWRGFVQDLIPDVPEIKRTPRVVKD